MKIKIFALVMVLALMAGMLVGCKKDDGPGGTGTVDPGETDTHYDNIWWDEGETFIFRLQENSNGQELPSSCARYLAGSYVTKDDPVSRLPEGEKLDDIDDMVDIRNAKAAAVTRVEPKFTYITEDDDKGWSKNISDMVYDMSNFVSGKTPDAYCNYVYDMICASLSGAFANLKTTSLKTDDKNGNWFRFVDPQYKDTGTGYMVEYMRSLSLSRNKQYCLSSDYFTDMVRAFFVVPVNISLLETFSADGEYGAFNYDYDNDGKYTIEDFYEYVYEYRWTYNTLAEISALGFYQNDATQASDTGDPNGDLHDRLIWAIGESSGLSSSGMLYTTSVTIINRELSTLVDGNGVEYTDYVYSYPTDNQDLFDFCAALTSLMSENQGVISITNEQSLGYYTGENAALLAIRDRFVNGRILFGGDICLGSLEYSTYGEMEGGFGVVPVPLFRTEHQETQADGTVTTVQDIYMTQIHNLGRIGGINAKTTKFAKISAYLDYQSVNSTDILEEYYKVKLCNDVAGGGSHKDMLVFIRENVRTSFDKAFEDAIGRLFAEENSGGNSSSVDDTSSEKQKWHAIISSGHFEVDAGTMATYYSQYVGYDNENGTKTGKAARLDSLEASYVGLPS